MIWVELDMEMDVKYEERRRELKEKADRLFVRTELLKDECQRLQVISYQHQDPPNSVLTLNSRKILHSKSLRKHNSQISLINYK